MVEQTPTADLLGLTAEIVAAHVSNNPVALGDLPNLIQEVYRTLSSVGRPVAEPEPERPPAGRADQEVGHSRIPGLSRGRQEAEDAEAALADVV